MIAILVMETGPFQQTFVTLPIEVLYENWVNWPGLREDVRKCWPIDAARANGIGLALSNGRAFHSGEL